MAFAGIRTSFWQRLHLRVRRLRIQLGEWSHRKITLVFIPHRKDHVYRINISPVLILFFGSLIAVLLSFFSLTLVISEQAQNQRIRLEDHLDVENRVIQKFLDNFTLIAHTMENFGPSIEKSQELIINQTINLKYLMQMLERRQKGLAVYHNMHFSPFFQNGGSISSSSILSVSSQLDFLLKNIYSMYSFIGTREDVLYNLPSTWPVTGGLITSLYGERYNPFTGERSSHYGIDIANSVGAPIRSSAPGEVVASVFSGQLGNMVKIKHAYGFYTVYGHNHRNLVKVGDKIKRGDLIAEVGQSGYATGPHCHYEVNIGDDAINPYPYLMIR